MRCGPLWVALGCLLVACSAAVAREGAVPSAPALPWESQPAVVTEVESPLTALVGATVMTGAGSEIPDGVVLFQNGRIEAVGDRQSTRIPAGARVVQLAGAYVTPGLIDTHSHMGLIGLAGLAGNGDGN